MGKSGEQRAIERQQLFDLYSGNWSAVRKRLEFRDIRLNTDDIYVCPICLQSFPRSSLLNPQELTLEHVPPKSVGGKDDDWILLCGNCNHDIGSKMDSQLHHALNVADFMNKVPGASTEARFSLGEDAPLPTTLRWSEEGHLLIFSDPNPKRSHPRNIEKHNEYAEQIKEGTRKFGGDFTVTWGKPRYREVALLRIAYLMVFRVFGYGPITHNDMLCIRNQILHPDEEIIPGDWSLGKIEFGIDATGVNIIREPKELRSFLVVFDLATKLTKTTHYIILPGPKEPGISIYRWLKENPASPKNPIHLVLEKITPDPDYIKNPKMYGYSDILWED